MRITLTTVVAVTLGFVAIPGAAKAWTGNICDNEAENGQTNGLAFHTQYGITNNSPYGQSVSCPIVFSSISVPNNINIKATVYDRNPTFDIYCTNFLLYPDGNVFSSQARHSSGGGIGSASQEFSFSNGIGEVEFLECYLPPSVDANWPSHITSIGPFGS